MKTSIKIIACIVSFAFLLVVPSAMAQADKLIGVWRPVEIVETDLNIPGIANGGPDAYIIFTEKYRFVVGSRVPERQALPESPTDSQFVAAWAPVWAFASTYEVKGNTVIEHLLFSKNPNEKQGEQGSHTFKFDGDDLIWTVKVNGGRNTVTQKCKRLE